MDAEVKAKWLSALRSGEYEQGRSFLNEKGKFCCLGVLGKIEDLMDAGGYVGTSNAFLRDSEANIILVPEAIQIRLASMNDEGKSFPEIADYIEANL